MFPNNRFSKAKFRPKSKFMSDTPQVRFRP